MAAPGTRLVALAAVAAAALVTACAGAAQAADAFPCEKATTVDWSTEPVQRCPLVGPLAEGVPVYLAPLPNPPGATPPRPDAWLAETTTALFVCDKEFPAAIYHHPQGWRNRWWAYTRAGDGLWGWVPEVFFRGGDDDEGDAGLRSCPPPLPPPPDPPSPPSPTPPAPPPDPPAPGPCDALPAGGDLRLQARVGHGRRARMRYGAPVRVRGRLAAPAGAAVAGASLCVLERTAARGAAERQVGTVATGADGAFAIPLERGPSRTVRLVYRDGAVAVSAAVAVEVRAPVGLDRVPRRVRPRGEIALRGALGEGAQARGVLVELQALRGRRFQTFGTTRTGGRGRFRYDYRFSAAAAGGSFRLRARVPRQPGFPYASGASRALGVHVAG